MLTSGFFPGSGNRWRATLILDGASGAECLRCGALAFRVEPALAAGTRRFRSGARSGRLRCTPDEGDQPVERVLPVALLGAEALSGDDDLAVARQLPAGESFESRTDVVWQRWG